MAQEMDMTNSRIIILAAGGTGGHIFPAEALAEVLLARGLEPVLVTDHRFYQYNKHPGQGTLGRIPIHTIRAGSFGGGLSSRLRSGVDILRGLGDARRLIRKLDPAAVVGFGGYPSFPTMMAAVWLNRVTIVHEQNSVLGKVNRALAKKVKRIAATYGDMQRLPAVAKDRITVTGNPVRAAVRALASAEYPMLAEGGMMRILVTGGSQGASVFGQVVPAVGRIHEHSGANRGTR